MIRNSEKSAFTLIELLVVISIIAILMAVMMPALNRARAQARFTLCGNNQNQILIGLTAYASDWGGKYPETIQRRRVGSGWTHNQVPYSLNYHSRNDASSNTGGGGGSIGLQLYSYIPLVDVWFCPFTQAIDRYKDSPRTTEDRYRYGSGGPDGTWAWAQGALAGTNYLLWNNDRWNRSNTIIGGERIGFEGGGDKSPNTLVLAEVVFWGYQWAGGDQLNRWQSTHPFRGSQRSNLLYELVDDYGGAPDAQIPNFFYPLNAGYLDGSVRRYNAEQTSRVGVSGQSNFIPAKELWR